MKTLKVSIAKRRIRKRKSRKRLAYGVIAVTFILLCFLTYFSLHQSNQASDGNAMPPRVQAAIVDHLNFTGQSNPAFVEECINILESGGLTRAYYNGKDVTVDFYRNLPSYGTILIILRVHSAIMKVNGEIIPLLGLFTSENYSDIKAGTTYRSDIYFDGEFHNDSLFRAYFPGENISYFAIGPKFVEKRMNGKFQNTIIIMMGCEGLGYVNTRTGTRIKYTDMAEAFINKGAKVYISWNGPISVNHTDQATLDLLQSLILHKRTIKRAVSETMEIVGKDPRYNSTLQYYPKIAEVENYAIPNLRSSLTMNVALLYPTPRTPKRFK